MKAFKKDIEKDKQNRKSKNYHKMSLKKDMKQENK